jgi:hypothetical protein
LNTANFAGKDPFVEGWTTEEYLYYPRNDFAGHKWTVIVEQDWKEISQQLSDIVGASCFGDFFSLPLK